MNPKYINFEVIKENGFRGCKFTATTYVDSKGKQITGEPEEGSEIIEIKAESRHNQTKLTQELTKDLIDSLTNVALQYKPIYEI